MKYHYFISWADNSFGKLEVNCTDLKLDWEITIDSLRVLQDQLREKGSRPNLIILAFSKFASDSDS